VVVNVGRAGAANLDVIQEVEYVKQEAKIVYLLECLQKTAPPVLIFACNQSDVDDIHEYLLLKGVNAVSIHGGKVHPSPTPPTATLKLKCRTHCTPFVCRVRRAKKTVWRRFRSSKRASAMCWWPQMWRPKVWTSPTFSTSLTMICPKRSKTMYAVRCHALLCSVVLCPVAWCGVVLTWCVWRWLGASHRSYRSLR
jgi:hypothetical protein